MIRPGRSSATQTADGATVDYEVLRATPAASRNPARPLEFGRKGWCGVVYTTVGEDLLSSIPFGPLGIAVPL